MNLYEIIGADLKDIHHFLEALYIYAEDFEAALSEARSIDPGYCGGHRIEEAAAQ